MDADDALYAALVLRRKVEAGDITEEQAVEAASVMGLAGDGPARLSLPSPGSSPPDPAAGPSLLAAASIRRKVLALSKKGSPPPSS